MSKKKRRSQKLPDEPKPLPVAPTEYQPSKAELEETVDMPGLLTRAKVRQTFLRSFRGPVAPTEYQPSKAELEETVDMPGLTRAKVRQTFLRSFQFKRDEPSR